MKGILKIQKDSVNTLKEEILSHSNSKLKKIYIIASEVKESGYDIIEECLIDLKARKFIAFGLDKKNTTRKMLENILKYTKNVYVWDNNSEIEFNSNVFVFEYDEESIVYLTSGGLTDSLFETDITIYNKLIFDLIKDKKEYSEYIDVLTKEIKDNFVKLTKEYIDELSEKKSIFTTKQYMHVVPSIAELLGKTDEADNKENPQPIKIPKVEIDTSDMDTFEIDLGDINLTEKETGSEKIAAISNPEQVETAAFGLDEVIEEENEPEYEISDEVIDMESLVLESEVVKLDKKKITKKVKEKEKVDKEKQLSKKINLAKVSNIIMELAKKPTKGKDINKIKVPNYIKDMIPAFFEVMEEAKLVNGANGEQKQVEIKLEVIDVNSGNKFVDNNAKINQKVGQTFVEFASEKLAEVNYEELDIARIIKLAKDSYHIEIIPQGIEEYNLWKKLCTSNFRGSTRQYGLM